MRTNTDEQKEFLNEKEAAARIGMSPSFLSHRRSEGFLMKKAPGPKYYKFGKSVRYRQTDLNAWLSNNDSRHMKQPSLPSKPIISPPLKT